jgi:signal transduction histidine kinase
MMPEQSVGLTSISHVVCYAKDLAREHAEFQAWLGQTYPEQAQLACNASGSVLNASAYRLRRHRGAATTFVGVRRSLRRRICETYGLRAIATVSYPNPDQLIALRIANSYGKLASLVARKASDALPATDVEIASEFRTLRQLQREHATRMTEFFHARHLMPPKSGPDILERIDEVLVRYERPISKDSSSGDPSAQNSNS